MDLPGGEIFRKDYWQDGDGGTWWEGVGAAVGEDAAAVRS